MGLPGLNVKSLALGTLGLVVVKKVVGKNSLTGLSAGSFDTPAQMFATGVALKMAKVDGNDLISAGIKTGLATAVDNYLATGNLMASSYNGASGASDGGAL